MTEFADQDGNELGGDEVSRERVRDIYGPRIAAIDAIENLLEYAKKDIIGTSTEELFTGFQESMIEHRSDLIDTMQDELNANTIESTPAGGGANNTRDD